MMQAGLFTRDAFTLSGVKAASSWEGDAPPPPLPPELGDAAGAATASQATPRAEETLTNAAADATASQAMPPAGQAAKLKPKPKAHRKAWQSLESRLNSHAKGALKHFKKTRGPLPGGFSRGQRVAATRDVDLKGHLLLKKGARGHTHRPHPQKSDLIN